MIKAAIEKIQALVLQGAETKQFSIGGKNYVTVAGYTYDDEPALPKPLTFSTLAGLVDYVKGSFDQGFQSKKAFIHVVNPITVELYSEAIPVYAKRPNLATVNAALPAPFDFGRFMDGESFMIAIQARFVQGVGDWSDVITSCAGIKKQEGAEYKDNGVAQTVAVQSGLSLASTKKLPNPVELAPYRTFPEVEQPCSKFVLRVTDGRMGPEIGLFEADGGAWKLVAIERIKAWLGERLPDITVIA